MVASKTIVVTAKDYEGFTLATYDACTLREAKKYAKNLTKDAELLAAGMVRVEVRVDGECLADWTGLQ